MLPLKKYIPFLNRGASVKAHNIKKIQKQEGFVVEKKPLNVTTLGKTKSDINNKIITIAE